MKRIYVDFSQLINDGGGYNRYCIILAKALDKISDFEFRFFLPKSYKKQFSQIIKNSKIITFNDSKGLIFLKREIFFIFKKRSFFPGNYTTLLNFSSNNILVIHDLKFIQISKYLDWKRKLFRYFMVYTSINKNPKIIAISKFTSKSISNFFKKKSVVIYTPSKPKKNNYKKIIGLPKTFYLTVLTKHQHKNAQTIFNVFKKLKKKKLVVVGNFNVKQSNIIILNNILDSELSYLYANCKAFLFPSLYEGLGLPVMEASFYHKPIICSELEPLREVTNGKAIYVNNPVDEDEWIHKIKLLQSKKFFYNNHHLFSHRDFINKLNLLFHETNYPRP